MVTVDDIRPRALALPRVTEALVRDRLKFRVGRIVWLAFSRDERTMGFAYPKEQRESLVASAPGKFLMPGAGDPATTGRPLPWTGSRWANSTNWSSTRGRSPFPGGCGRRSTPGAVCSPDPVGFWR